MTASQKPDSRSLRDAFGAFATGVTIITTVDRDGQNVGLTANSFNSVSLDPPMVLWSLARTSLSLAAFKHAEYFAVHVLSADQEPLSNLFATRGADKFAGLHLEHGLGGTPLLPGCAARFQCRTAFAYEGGDHEIFVGDVLDFEDFKRTPLVFQGGKYALAIKKPASRNAANTDMVERDANFTKDYLGHLLAVAHSQMKVRFRPVLEARDLDETDYSILSLLIIADREVAEIAGLLQIAGKQLHEATFERLKKKDLIATHVDGGEPTCLSLTPTGRRTTIELMAAAKAAEADTEIGLDYSESQMLKHLLKRVIRSTTQGTLKIWKRPS